MGYLYIATKSFKSQEGYVFKGQTFHATLMSELPYPDDVAVNEDFDIREYYDCDYIESCRCSCNGED